MPPPAVSFSAPVRAAAHSASPRSARAARPTPPRARTRPARSERDKRRRPRPAAAVTCSRFAAHRRHVDPIRSRMRARDHSSLHPFRKLTPLAHLPRGRRPDRPELQDRAQLPARHQEWKLSCCLAFLARPRRPSTLAPLLLHQLVDLARRALARPGPLVRVRVPPQTCRRAAHREREIDPVAAIVTPRWQTAAVTTAAAETATAGDSSPATHARATTVDGVSVRCAMCPIASRSSVRMPAQ